VHRKEGVGEPKKNPLVRTQKKLGKKKKTWEPRLPSWGTRGPTPVGEKETLEKGGSGTIKKGLSLARGGLLIAEGTPGGGRKKKTTGNE